MKMKIVLATHNMDKCAEMKSIMRQLPVKLLTLNEYPKIGEIIENGRTLLENALIKARTFHKLTNLPA